MSTDLTMTSRYTRYIPLVGPSGAPIKPAYLRVTVRGPQGSSEPPLDIALPHALVPSAVGVQAIVGVASDPEVLDDALREAPRTGEQSIRLWIEDPVQEEDPVMYWYAIGPTTFEAIWREIRLFCEESELEIVSVEIH